MLINVICLAIMSELGRSLSLPTTAAAEFPDRGYPAADFLSDSCGGPHNSVTEIARTAQQLCGGLSVEKTLRSVRLQPRAVEQTAQLMLELGVRTALDLQLLGGGPEAEELMGELQAVGLSLGDRAKVRLLIGDRTHLGRFAQLGIIMESSKSSTDSARTSYKEDQFPRLLQEKTESDGGMSMDTMAIVLSVLVAAAGYFVQAYTARRAERSVAEQAQELHTRELARQREHEQMLAQIARTDRALDDCCRPIQAALEGIHNSRYQFVGGAVLEMEASAPEAVARMLEKVTIASVTATQAISTRSGEVKWDAAARPETLTHVHGVNTSGFKSPAAYAIAGQDLMTWSSQPFTSELPAGILECVSADPTTALAHRFRLYVRHSLLAGMLRVVKLLDAHAAVVELPPTSWLKAKFPEELWNVNPGQLYRWFWRARTQAWEALVAEWDGGDFGAVSPPGNFLPFHGLIAINDWAIARGEERQRELIGMTAQAEVPVEAYGDRLSGRVQAAAPTTEAKDGPGDTT